MAKTTKTRVRRSAAEWQHLIAEYSALPHGGRGAWYRHNGITPSTVSSKRKALGLAVTPSKAKPAAKSSTGGTSMNAAEEIEFLRYLLRAARRQGFLSAIIDIE